jgi:hypothetical protein
MIGVVATLVHSRAIVPAIPATGKKLSKKARRLARPLGVW